MVEEGDRWIMGPAPMTTDELIFIVAMVYVPAAALILFTIIGVAFLYVKGGIYACQQIRGWWGRA